MSRKNVWLALSSVVGTCVLVLFALPGTEVRNPGGHVWSWGWLIAFGIALVAVNIRILTSVSVRTPRSLKLRVVAQVMLLIDLAFVGLLVTSPGTMPW